MLYTLNTNPGLTIYLNDISIKLLPGEYRLCKAGIELVLPTRLGKFSVVEFGIAFADSEREILACSAVVVDSVCDGDNGTCKTSLLFLDLSEQARMRITSAIS